MKNTTTTNAPVATQTAHTPAPWIQDATPAHAPCSFIIRSKSAHCDAWVPVRMNDSANSKRIVQCVNACEGMADPAVEIAALRAKLEAHKKGLAELCKVAEAKDVEIAGLRSRSNGIEGMCAEVERLRAVNADLLAALERVLADSDAGNAETAETSRWKEAHAAIAKATGGAK